jgi:hypothetical protein
VLSKGALSKGTVLSGAMPPLSVGTVPSGPCPPASERKLPLSTPVGRPMFSSTERVHAARPLMIRPAASERRDPDFIQPPKP